MAITFIQSGQVIGAISANAIIPISPSGTGNLIVVLILGSDVLGRINGVTDNAGNTYYQVANAQNSLSGAGIIDLWYAANSLPGATAITIASNGSVLNGVYTAAEYSGVQTTSPVDDGENNHVTNGSPTVGPVLTSTKTGDLFVTFVSKVSANPTGVTSPWVVIPGSSFANFVHRINNDAAGPQHAIYTPSQTDSFIGSGAAFFEVAAAVAPTITVQPISQTVNKGSTATFSVTATGTDPLSYQWSLNGTPIMGATSASYTTPTLAYSDNGNSYTVEVSNTAGSVTSNPAILTVPIPYWAPFVFQLNGYRVWTFQLPT